MALAITSDSTHYLPRELVAQHHITEVSLYVRLMSEPAPRQEVALHDEVEQFYRQLAREDAAAKTSQPSIGDFMAAWQPLLDAGHDVVSIHLSSGISGTCETARVARQMLVDSGLDPARIVVVDSQRACGGLGLLLLAAATAAASGAAVADTCGRIDAARTRLRMWFAVDTLEYLQRGGRIGGAQAWFGSALKIKPILTLDGEIKPIERMRTRKRAFDRLVDFLRELEACGCDGWVVQHIQAQEVAARLVDEGRAIFGCEPVFVSEVGPVIGAHIGPGLVGVGGVPSTLLQ